jgi:hypothetical protein
MRLQVMALSNNYKEAGEGIIEFGVFDVVMPLPQLRRATRL